MRANDRPGDDRGSPGCYRQGVTTEPAAPPRRSPMAAAFTDREGELRGTLIVGLVAAALMVMAVSGTVAMMLGGMVSRDAMAGLVLVVFLAVKVPLLALLWWVLGRRREGGAVGGWGSKECREILDYLEREARASLGRPGAEERLAYYCREAWFVARSAAPADTAAAVALAERIDAMASEAGVDTARARAEAMSPAGSRRP